MSPLSPSLVCTTESSVFSDSFQHAGQASDKLCPTSAESEKDKPSDSTPAPLSRSQVSLLVCLSLSNLLAGSCTVVQSPFFTPEAHLRGLSSAASGAVFSCFALVQMLAFPAMGWLAPRIGVTRLYTLGLLVAGVTTVVFGLLTYVEQPAAFLAWSLTVRSAEAVGTAAAQTAVRTIIINQFPRRVNSAMSLVEGMTGAGLCLGPAIGGSMYALGGYGAPFYTLGALFFVTAAASLLLMPKMTDHSTERTEMGDADRNYRDMLILVLSTADNWLIFAALLVAAMNWTAMDPSMEPYMHAVLGIQPAELSLFFLGSFAGYALSSPLWGRLSDYIDNTFLLVAGSLAPTALGVLLIPPSPLLGLRPSRVLLGVGMTLREVFQIGAYLPLLPLMVRRSTARGLQSDVSGQALLSAVFGAAYSLGNVLGPVGGGLVTDLWGYPTLATWLGGVTVVLCVTLAARGLVYHVTR
ncbi:MFS-type transporter SLC18B1-like [Amphibalanus amphitrite]|uniref:MFS-type transporter SLC18B1-like n=1 Tax=Amphibalanus amphitrite TaxID=1232801 RepID=UPI001C910D34|nr:MFS-type transporter SLC18B1-like [Amphibalanus amphitrite]